MSAVTQCVLTGKCLDLSHSAAVKSHHEGYTQGHGNSISCHHSTSRVFEQATCNASNSHSARSEKKTKSSAFLLSHRPPLLLKLKLNKAVECIVTFGSVWAILIIQQTRQKLFLTNCNGHQFSLLRQMTYRGCRLFFSLEIK